MRLCDGKADMQYFGCKNIKSPGMLVNLDIGRDKYFPSMPALNTSHFSKILPCVLFPLNYVQKFSLVNSGDLSM